MAYNTGDRFPPQPEYYRLLDPCAYQNGSRAQKSQSPAPFLSKAPRNIQDNRVYTQAIYYPNVSPKIPNCTSLMEKRPRFPYEALSKEDLEEILCKCGINVCECSSEENVIESECQGLVPRRLYKGHPPRSAQGEGLSMPCQRDKGFELLPDGTQRRLLNKISDARPPFYDVRVEEATAFYRGCKWSHWTSKRASKALQQTPGPADYNVQRQPTQAELCLEKLRSYNKKRSKQPRYMEMVQESEIRDGRPGPATYTPNLPKGAEVETLGPKAERFPPQPRSNLQPGPADHMIKREFDLRERPLKPCRFKLPEYSGFGKAARFRSHRVEGPSPDAYSINDKLCKFMHCPNGGFGSTAIRFKQEPIDEGNDDDDAEFTTIDDAVVQLRECPKLTWEFKSKTVRMRPLKIKLNEQSPADNPQTKPKPVRSKQLQYTSPFNSSEGRFRPWYDWLPITSPDKTPGPGYYSLGKPKCNPAVCRGPLVRTQRFPPSTFQTPAPNEYTVGRGLETVLGTHNVKLKLNIENQYKFHWEPPVDHNTALSFEQRESNLLDKAIALLDVENKTTKTVIPKDPETSINASNPKMLRYFLYNHSIPVPD